MMIKIATLLATYGVVQGTPFASFIGAPFAPEVEIVADVVTDAPVVVVTERQQRLVGGNWINCQPIRIDEHIWDNQRLTHLDLPEIWFTSNQVCSYAVTGPNAAIEYFDLDQALHGANQASAKLKLIKRLDREIQDVHSIEITAYDCSSAVLKTGIIEIVVGDINDHIPWMQAESLAMTFCPDMPIGTTIGYLRGADLDIGAYADLRYLFTYRKPYGTQIIVTRMDDTVEMMDNIFSLNSESGEVKLVVDNPQIDNTVKTISIEVAVRDHPDNPIYGQRTAQLLITLCNQPPLVEVCNLGEIIENANVGTILTGTDIRVRDSDSKYINTIVGFEVEDNMSGLVTIIPTTVDGITTGVVKVTRGFNYEAIPVEGVDGRKVLMATVILTNPKANEPVETSCECSITIIDVDDEPRWPTEARSGLYKGPLKVIEGCLTEVDTCIDEDSVYAIDEDNDSKDITYSAADSFFKVHTNHESKRAKICLSQVIDREKDCTVQLQNDPHGRYYGLRVVATEQDVSIASTIHIKCIDINDNYPIVTLSPAPYSGVICQQLERNFSDYNFLESNDIEGVTLHDGKDGCEIVAIAVVSDADDPSAGHTYPYHFTVTSENADEISLVATENPDVYLVAYCGTRTMLASSETIKITVTDNGVVDEDVTRTCQPELRQPHGQIVDGALFEYFLHACDCEDNDDDEYYPHETTCAYIAGGLWWIPLLLLFLLLLLCLLCICCYYCCCGGGAVAAPTEEKTHTYSKKEADKVFHTYDEKRIYNMEGVANQNLTNNRMSMVSGVSELSRMTGMTAGTAPDDRVDWPSLLEDVPEIIEVIVPDRATSALSNVTDVTVNENKINILRNHHLIATHRASGGTLKTRAAGGIDGSGGSAFAAGGPQSQGININDPSMLVQSGNPSHGAGHGAGHGVANRSASFYNEGLIRSSSRASNHSPNRHPYQYATQMNVDQNQRALSPTSQMRYTQNKISNSETDSELDISVGIDIQNGNGTTV